VLTSILWLQVEEEEYTSRIIHCFSTGLLTLPEGSTLRSYIADKLNCDPMRVTKKYAGAACLGRRVCHFRDQVHPTMAEIQLSKLELGHLEQRFRLQRFPYRLSNKHIQHQRRPIRHYNLHCSKILKTFCRLCYLVFPHFNRMLPYRYPQRLIRRNLLPHVCHRLRSLRRRHPDHRFPHYNLHLDYQDPPYQLF
jgi:hypothetical protein